MRKSKVTIVLRDLDNEEVLMYEWEMQQFVQELQDPELLFVQVEFNGGHVALINKGIIMKVRWVQYNEATINEKEKQTDDQHQ